MLELFRWLALFYRENAYMAGTRIAGVLCSWADIVMIWMFLRLTDSVRADRSRDAPSGKARYRILIFFAVITPTLFLPKVSTHFFLLQFFVLGVPYLLLVYTVVREAPRLLCRLRRQREISLSRKKP